MVNIFGDRGGGEEEGSRGERGAIEPAGRTGPPGTKGDAGKEGVRGPKGSKGDQEWMDQKVIAVHQDQRDLLVL